MGLRCGQQQVLSLLFVSSIPQHAVGREGPSYVLLSSGFFPGSWEPEPRRVAGALPPAMHGLDRKASSAGPEQGTQFDGRMHA